MPGSLFCTVADAVPAAAVRPDRSMSLNLATENQKTVACVSCMKAFFVIPA